MNANQPQPNPVVEKSISRPSAFSKPGTMSTGNQVRFRSLMPKRTPGRPRKHPKDKRIVTYY